MTGLVKEILALIEKDWKDLNLDSSKVKKYLIVKLYYNKMLNRFPQRVWEWVKDALCYQLDTLPCYMQPLSSVLLVFCVHHQRRTPARKGSPSRLHTPSLWQCKWNVRELTAGTDSGNSTDLVVPVLTDCSNVWLCEKLKESSKLISPNPEKPALKLALIP